MTVALCPDHNLDIRDCWVCRRDIERADAVAGVARLRAAIRSTGVPQRTDSRRAALTSPALQAELDRIQTRRAHRNPTTDQEDQS